jgi:hypothetical protein
MQTLAGAGHGDVEELALALAWRVSRSCGSVMSLRAAAWGRFLSLQPRTMTALELEALGAVHGAEADALGGHAVVVVAEAVTESCAR